MFILNLSSKEC